MKVGMIWYYRKTENSKDIKMKEQEHHRHFAIKCFAQFMTRSKLIKWQFLKLNHPWLQNE